MNDAVSALAANIVATLKGQLGAAWENLYTPVERDLIESVADDAAALQLAAAALPASDAVGMARLLAEKRQINAQLANLAATVQGDVASVLWKAAAGVIGAAVSFALAAA